MKQAKIIVTGGAGYIGSHTVVELQQQGYEVVIIDNLSNSHAKVIDNIEEITHCRPVFEQFDLCDKQACADCFERHADAQALIHFAAHKAVGESVEQPLMYYDNNMNALMNVLHNMAAFAIPHLVFSSSCTVYGQAELLPVTEKTPLQKALSPYGNTKRIAEEIIDDCTKAMPVKAILLRYFNPIGAHPTALIGELPLGVPNNLVPFITQTAAGIRAQLSVFGDDYNTPDGTAIRDYIHVVDLAKAHVVAVERMIHSKQKKDCEVFNLGTGNGFSVLEVIKSFEKVSHTPLNYKIVGRRAGDIEIVYADTSFANNELGWQATESLDNMMASAWKWQKHLSKK